MPRSGFRRGEIGSRKKRYKLSRVRERDGDACWVCGVVVDVSVPADHPASWSLDHVVEVRDGGTWRLENLRLAHKACNAWRAGHEVQPAFIVPGRTVRRRVDTSARQ